MASEVNHTSSFSVLTACSVCRRTETPGKSFIRWRNTKSTHTHVWFLLTRGSVVIYSCIINHDSDSEPVHCHTCEVQRVPLDYGTWIRDVILIILECVMPRALDYYNRNNSLWTEAATSTTYTNEPLIISLVSFMHLIPFKRSWILFCFTSF